MGVARGVQRVQVRSQGGVEVRPRASIPGTVEYIICRRMNSNISGKGLRLMGMKRD